MVVPQPQLFFDDRPEPLALAGSFLEIPHGKRARMQQPAKCRRQHEVMPSASDRYMAHSSLLFSARPSYKIYYFLYILGQRDIRSQTEPLQHLPVPRTVPLQSQAGTNKIFSIFRGTAGQGELNIVFTTINCPTILSHFVPPWDKVGEIR